MRTGVIFWDYRPMHDTKDHGMYMRALRATGHDPVLITTDKPALDAYQPSHYALKTVASAKPSDLARLLERERIDVVLGVNWLSRHAQRWLDVVIPRQIPLIIKADTDGYVSARLWPTQHLRRTLHQARGGFVNPLAPGRWMASSVLAPLLDRKLLNVFRQSRFVIVETAPALANLRYFLHAYQADALSHRLVLLENPVDALFTGPRRLPAKYPQVALVARWQDSQKNTRQAIRATYAFLGRYPRYRVVVAGSGLGAWRRAARRTPAKLAGRVSLVGMVEHRVLSDFLATSRILLSASFAEGSPLSMAEALCMGTTVVGTPIPGALHFIDQGRFGTPARGFHWRSLVEALTIEALHWDQGQRDAAAIAQFWRDRLHLDSIAPKLGRLVAGAAVRPVEGPSSDGGVGEGARFS